MNFNPKKFCHHKPTLIFSTKNANYHAADHNGVASFEGDLIINLTQHPGIKVASNVWGIPQLAKHMKHFPEELSVMWDDFEEPPVRATFWRAIDDYAKTKGIREICWHCAQGHGRTGTAVSAMLIANKGKGAEEAIFRVREEYCDQAVESDTQIRYLFHLDTVLNGRKYEDKELAMIVGELTPLPTWKNFTGSAYFDME